MELFCVRLVNMHSWICSGMHFFICALARYVDDAKASALGARMSHATFYLII